MQRAPQRQAREVGRLRRRPGASAGVREPLGAAAAGAQHGRRVRRQAARLRRGQQLQQRQPESVHVRGLGDWRTRQGLRRRVGSRRARRHRLPSRNLCAVQSVMARPSSHGHKCLASAAAARTQKHWRGRHAGCTLGACVVKRAPHVARRRARCRCHLLSRIAAAPSPTRSWGQREAGTCIGKPTWRQPHQGIPGLHVGDGMRCIDLQSGAVAIQAAGQRSPQRGGYSESAASKQRQRAGARALTRTSSLRAAPTRRPYSHSAAQ